MYSDEVLSRILGEHAAGLLVQFGCYDWTKPVWPYPATTGLPMLLSCGCINQAGFNESDPGAAKHLYGAIAQRLAGWFDCPCESLCYSSVYSPDLTPDELLYAIEYITADIRLR